MTGGMGSQQSEGGMGMPGQSQASHDPTKTFSDKVDLNDLEWEDRERVLRLLFSKMNAGVQTNTLAARQTMKQAQNREQNQAMSDQQMMQNDQMQGYREQYGNQAFDQYMQEESRRDEESQYG